MSISFDKSPQHKRENLFLLRVWCDDMDENEHGNEHEHEHGNSAGGPTRTWHGKVQRTVSGEEHSFAAKADLMAVLEAMIYKHQILHSRRRLPGKTSSAVG
jgi:hypothetical protein